MRRLMYQLGLIGVVLGLLGSVMVVKSLVTPVPAYAIDRLPCANSAYTINELMPNGARWIMCWEERHYEGVVLRAIQYAPPNGAPMYIMSQASLAQIFVPYDAGEPRIHDLSDFGMGDSNMLNLATSDCPGGVLLQNNGRNIVCKTVSPVGYGYKYQGIVKQAAALKLFSVSQLGAYSYVIQWTFYDDGTIQPGVGATGQLQFCTSNPNFGWLIEGQLRCTQNSGQPYGMSHSHSYYWRLDFDIAQITNNVVEQLDFDGTTTTVRSLVKTPLTVETAAQVEPARFRSWRIANPNSLNTQGHVQSYELIPNSDHVLRGPANEPWTQNDFYVTQYRDCELWASHNPPNTDCADANNVADYVNGQTLTDPIIWYGLTFHHLPRDEDDPFMSAHWSEFLLLPRDMFATQKR